MKPLFLSTAALALAAALAPLPLAAQAVVQPLHRTLADDLGDVMRRLASNPRDLNALIEAGDLSIRMGDLSAAASLFARADKIAPRDGRVKAGMGSVLVRSERPGEALRFFQQAESFGVSPSRFAADRGLAYDLIGEQARAQADYRLALAKDRDDETLRRYALSLGISGQQAQALEQLDPLVRQQDRAAWRARAFVMAMSGDTAGANKIATTMMPATMAQGLGAFFQRLPTLPAADRAFAVHFGEIFATPERIADARLIPPLPPLARDASAPVQVAATSTIQPVESSRKPSRRREPAAARPVASRPVQVAAAPVVTMAPAREVVQPVPAQPVVTPAPVAVAAVQPVSPPKPSFAPPSPVVQPVPVQPYRVETATTPPARVAPVESSASTRRTDAVLARIVASLSIPASELGVEEPVRAVTQTPRPEEPANLATAPASEVGHRVVTEATAKEARDTAVRRVVAARLTGDAGADDAVPAKPRTAAERRAAERLAKAEAAPKTAAERRAAARLAKADTEAEPAPMTPAERRAAARKAAADKKAAAEKKALADKEAAEKKAARANPSRIWVQVAGGANADDLPKAWKSAQGKASALKSRGGYTTKNRATNRVLTGPFKTDAEARAFVNQLAKEGVSAFAFTSDAGQPVTKLPAK